MKQALEIVRQNFSCKITKKSADLEMKPLLDKVFLWRASVVQGVILVVSFLEIFDNSSWFPQCDASVGVLNGKDPALYVYFLIWWLMEFCHVCWGVSANLRRRETRFTHHLLQIRNFELLKDNCNLPWIGTGSYELLMEWPSGKAEKTHHDRKE